MVGLQQATAEWGASGERREQVVPQADRQRCWTCGRWALLSGVLLWSVAACDAQQVVQCELVISANSLQRGRSAKLDAAGNPGGLHGAELLQHRPASEVLWLQQADIAGMSSCLLAILAPGFKQLTEGTCRPYPGSLQCVTSRAATKQCLCVAPSRALNRLACFAYFHAHAACRLRPGVLAWRRRCRC